MNSFTFRPVGTSREEVDERNRLLQTTLRAEFSCKYPIEQEYPLVLGESTTDSSFGLFDKSNILVSHVNLLFRNLLVNGTLTDSKITLIGNVATHPDHQGNGLMRLLFKRAEELALNKNSLALILWSDLDLFYQKLGFMSVGREGRFLLNRTKLAKFRQNKLFLVKQSELSLELLSTLLSLRVKCPLGIGRTEQEFFQLLTIPDCDLFVSKERNCYLILGKGCDMKGVVHEWGSTSPDDLVCALADLNSFPSVNEELCVLAPSCLNKEWTNKLTSVSKKVEHHPMGWRKDLSRHSELTPLLNDLFIWGLDSI